ncbi:MAG: hypothetical protein IIY97_04425 [Firmicutes bacterium]|nr:hypothetical protein [Bacillota bacterium]MBQ1690260.1 hypothetical protein [Bacillota bacterium]
MKTKEYELTLENLMEESAGYIRRICIDRRMCADSGLDCEAFDAFITEEMRRNMDKYDNIPTQLFAAELLSELISHGDWDITPRTES